MNGFINLLKPPGMTSNDAVMVARRMLHEKRIGHAGTLDPEAVGVLPLGVGKATRLLAAFSGAGKTYWCELIMGCETDTCDAYGNVCAKHDNAGDESALRAALPAFVGIIPQRPPIYAALRHQGKKLYEWARMGVEIDVPSRLVEIHAIELLEAAPPKFTLRVRCGAGTYIRALCRDLGRAIGGTAHMGMLVRETAGCFSLQDAVTLEDLQNHSAMRLLPMKTPFMGWPEVQVPTDEWPKLRNGNPLSARVCGAHTVPGRCRVMVGETFVAVGDVGADADTVSIRTLLIDPREELHG